MKILITLFVCGGMAIPSAFAGVVDRVKKDAALVEKDQKDQDKNYSRDGVNQDANRAASKSGGAAAANAAAGAALIAAGMAMKPPNMALIAMGMLALAQSGADSSQQGYATNTGIDAYNGEKGSKAKVPAKTQLTPGQQRQVADAEKAMSDAGVKFNGNSVTMADGTTLTGADFADPSKMAELGDEMAESVKKGLDIAKEAAKDLKLSYEAASGTAGKKSADGGGIASVEDEIGGPSLSDELNRRSSVAGMTRSLASDRIGVSGDNIFEMLSRRYQKKSRANAFLP